MKLVLIRHGESLWNQENRFTGWTDIDLSPKGIEEAKAAGRLLLKEGFTFDVAFSSVLKRAIRTLWHIQDEMGLLWIPIERSWRLNERHYGALQGLNKAEMAAKYGEEQVHVWRRSYDTLPPLLEAADERSPARDARYASIAKSDLPMGESLKTTVERFVPYWNQTIRPAMQSGKKVLIAAHGNSIRAFVKHIDQISDGEIAERNIPTGVPLVYEFDSNFKVLSSRYLGDADAIAKAQAAVAKQGQAK